MSLSRVLARATKNIETQKARGREQSSAMADRRARDRTQYLEQLDRLKANGPDLLYMAHVLNCTAYDIVRSENKTPGEYSKKYARAAVIRMHIDPEHDLELIEQRAYTQLPKITFSVSKGELNVDERLHSKNRGDHGVKGVSGEHCRKVSKTIVIAPSCSDEYLKCIVDGDRQTGLNDQEKIADYLINEVLAHHLSPDAMAHLVETLDHSWPEFDPRETDGLGVEF